MKPLTYYCSTQSALFQQLEPLLEQLSPDSKLALIQFLSESLREELRLEFYREMVQKAQQAKSADTGLAFYQRMQTLADNSGKRIELHFVDPDLDQEKSDRPG